VLSWADLREERMPEILAQISDTYAFWGSIVPLHTDRLRHTREVLDAAVQMAMFVEMRFKHELACWRPIDYSPQIQPAITTPGHGTLPSGHCVEAYVIREVLQALLGVDAKNSLHDSVRLQFGRIAARIATNRVVAGVHFPVDNVAGRMLGTALGRYFVFCCKEKPSPKDPPAWHHGVFLGTKCEPAVEFDPERQAIFDVSEARERPPFYRYDAVDGLDGLMPEPSVLKPIWDAATVELNRLSLPF
jgi:hypothetical protein